MDGRVPLPKAALLAPSDRERCNRNRNQTYALNVASTHVSRVLVCVFFQLEALATLFFRSLRIPPDDGHLPWVPNCRVQTGILLLPGLSRARRVLALTSCLTWATHPVRQSATGLGEHAPLAAIKPPPLLRSTAYRSQKAER
jgi:hypothetical protein